MPEGWDIWVSSVSDRWACRDLPYWWCQLIAFVALFLARSPAAKQAALRVPLWILLGAQTFRIGVELFLHRLWLDGMAPRMLTYAGANFDMIVGLSAPIVAWVYWRGRIGERAALAWNIAGLAMLANVALRAL